MGRTKTGLVTFAAVALLALAGCKDKITSSNYDSIRTDSKAGMTLQEVEGILGPGDKQEVTGVNIGSGGVASGSTASSQLTFVWKKNGKEISVTFQDGKAVSKSQFGL